MAVLLRDAASLEGAVLDGRFAVGQTMARGGFATVFAGRDLVEERPCAVKIFRHELAEKIWMGRRFQQEVTALKQIRHVNVVGTARRRAAHLTWRWNGWKARRCGRF